jgi:hypothetical protein
MASANGVAGVANWQQRQTAAMAVGPPGGSARTPPGRSNATTTARQRGAHPGRRPVLPGPRSNPGLNGRRQVDVADRCSLTLDRSPAPTAGPNGQTPGGTARRPTQRARAQGAIVWPPLGIQMGPPVGTPVKPMSPK